MGFPSSSQRPPPNWLGSNFEPKVSAGDQAIWSVVRRGSSAVMFLLTEAEFHGTAVGA